SLVGNRMRSTPAVASTVWMAGPPMFRRAMMRTTGAAGTSRLPGLGQPRQIAQPQLHREQCPQLLAMVSATAHVMVKEVDSDLRSHVRPDARRRSGQVVKKIGFEVTPKPGCEWDTEAHLSTSLDLGRQKVREGTPQNVLGRSPSELEVI